MKLMRSIGVLVVVSFMVVSNNKAASSKSAEEMYHKRMKRMQERQREQDAEKVAINHDENLLHACQDIENPAKWSEVITAVLHCKSVTQRRLESIEEYLKSGAQPNRVFKNDKKSGVTGWTPFHWAVGNNSPQLVAILLKYKGDVQKPVETISAYGDAMTPLGIAAVNYTCNDYGMLMSLRSKTAAPVCYGISWDNNLNIGKMLLRAGVQPQNDNDVESDYYTALIHNKHVFRDPNPICAGGF